MMAEFLWCQCHDKPGSSGDDKITAEILRCLICESAYGAANVRDRAGTDELEDRYVSLIRSSLHDGGINNYAESVLPLIANQRNESDDWKSSLNFSSYVSQLLSHSPPMAVESSQPIVIPQDNTYSVVKPLHLDSTQREVELKAMPIALPQALPIVQTTKATSATPAENTDHPALCVNDISHQDFRTAKEQLLFNHAANNRNTTLSNPGGQIKKSLGPRRAAGKFVSPLLQDSAPNGTGAYSTAASTALKPRPESSVYDDDIELPEQLAHLDANIVKLIMNEIMDTTAHVAWSDIAGLEFPKKTLKEIIILPMLRPDIFTGLRGPPKGLLLFGPPGTGKTLIGKCVASQSKCTFFSISASSLTSKWVGEGEKMVRGLFAVARYKQPAVVFIDEVDSLLTQRSESEHESSRRIKTEFLVQMDGVGCDGDDRILIIGATNRPQELDEAARRRFVKRLYIPLPESAARLAIIKNLMQRQQVDMAESELQSIVTMTTGYSGADMTNLCKEAALGPVRDIQFEEIETIQLDQVRPINYGDFTKALKQVRASVDSTDLNSYLAWNSKFGSWEIKASHD